MEDGGRTGYNERMSRCVPIAATLALVACATQPAPSAPPRVIATVADAGASTSADASEEEARADAGAPAEARPPREELVAIAPRPGRPGAVVAGVRGRELVLHDVSPDGTLGPATLLTTADDEPKNVAADARGEAAWIAWQVVTETTTTYAMRAAPAKTAPIALIRVDAPTLGSLRLVTLADGSAVVAANGPSGPAPCLRGAHPPEDRGKPCSGPGYEVVRVQPDGAVKKLHHAALDGGPEATIDALVDVGDAVVVGAFAWRGGAVYADALVPYGPKPPHGYGVAALRPPRQAWITAGELVTYSPDDFCMEEQRPVCEGIVTYRPNRDRKKNLSGVVDEKAEICDGSGQPALEMKTKAGSVRRPLGVWTGNAAVELDGGKLHVRTCKNGAIVKP